jgi:hypothetical protein
MNEQAMPGATPRFRMKRNLYFVLLLSLFVSCVAYSQTASPKKEEDRSEAEILAAVVRYATLPEKGIVFLRVNGRDPSSETLRSLAAWNVRILPASRAVYVSVPNGVGAWKDVKTGELGRYLTAENVKRITGTRVEVAAGWWQPCGTYAVTFQHGSWSVENYKAWDTCF